MEQNYFEFDQRYCKRTNGLAVGAPTSSLLAETYIQHTEHRQIYPILIKEQITARVRYAQKKTNIEHTLNKFKKLQPCKKVTIEKELHESINFLDLTIHRKDQKDCNFQYIENPRRLTL
jgi:hypothetical protein